MLAIVAYKNKGIVCINAWGWTCPRVNISRPQILVLAVAWFVMGCSPASQTKPETTIPVTNERASRPAPRQTLEEQGVDTDEAILEAEAAFTEGRFQEADKLVREVLIQEPDNMAASFLSAHLAAGQNDLASAVTILQAIPGDDPKYGLSARGQRAEWLADLGRIDESLATYEDLVSAYPEVDLIRHQMAKLLNEVGLRYRASIILEPLLSNGEITEQELRGLVDLTNSFASTQNASVVDAPMREGPLSKALKALSMRQPRVALSVLSSSKSSASTEAAREAVTAACLAELQRYTELDELIATRSNSIEDYPLFWRAIGDHCLFLNQREDAVRAYTWSLQLDSSNTIAHERLIAGLSTVGRIDAARRLDNRLALLLEMKESLAAIGRDAPDDLKAGGDLADDLERIGQPHQAVAWLRLIANRHPNSDLAARLASRVQRLQSYSGQDAIDRQLLGLAIRLAPGEVLESNHQSTPSQLDASIPSSKVAAKPDFRNRAGEVQLDHQFIHSMPYKHRNYQIYESFGGGVAAFDFDLDGRVDLYFTQAGGDPQVSQVEYSNVLFQASEVGFQNVTWNAGVQDFGYSTGVTSGDLNQDGFPDLVVGALGVNRYFMNQGDGTFVDMQSRDWLGSRGPVRSSNYTMSLGIADVTGDHLPEIVEVNYVDDDRIFEPVLARPSGYAVTFPGPLHFAAQQDCMWVSQGDAQWHWVGLGDASEDSDSLRSAAIGDVARPGLGLLISNLDDDADLEIFVANDARPNQLWKRAREASSQNQARFEDLAVVRGCAFSSRGESSACMGIGYADFDRNGLDDLVVTNWYDEWVNFFRQSQGGHFQDSAALYQLNRHSEGMLGFGCQGLDFDNNGLSDLVIGNGHVDKMPGQTQKMPTQLLINQGNHFELASVASDEYWGRDHLGRCLVKLDTNRDGRMDFVLTDLEENVVLMENQTQDTGNWLQLDLVGTECERDAIGAKVTIQLGDDQTMSTTLATGDGFQGRNEAIVSFGLGAGVSQVSVEIRWPSGNHSSFEYLVTNRRYLVVEKSREVWGD